VINKITGQYVNKVIWTWYKLIKVNLWDIDWKFVQVLSGLKIGDKICK
jgi:hypothetical protein